VEFDSEAWDKVNLTVQSGLKDIANTQSHQIHSCLSSRTAP
jgi:hypothetical protein